MAQPTAYVPAFDFEDYQEEEPSTPLPGNRVDIEFAALKLTTDEIRTNLALIQRDDGALANNSVGLEQLKGDVVVGINSSAPWETGTAYVVNDGVWVDGILYRCEVAHTSSGSFATDLAAEYWTEVVDMSDVIDGTASSFAAGNVTAPGLSVVGVPDTGFYIPGADELAISLAGEAAARFRHGSHIIYSGSDFTNSDSLFNLRSTVASGDRTTEALWSILFSGLNDAEENEGVGQIEGWFESDANGSEQGRVTIKTRDETQGAGFYVQNLDCRPTYNESDVPIRYDAGIATSEIASDEYIPNNERVKEIIADGEGAPFPIHAALLGSVGDATYPILRCIHPFTISAASVILTSGTATVKFVKNAADIVGLTGFSASSTVDTQSVSGGGTESLVAGDMLFAVVSGGSSPVNMTIAVDATLDSGS